jgi:nucleotidyltransferase/DNA polymerase involved in DNA repair
MNDTIFSLRSRPRAILHIDGAAFFTSCEDAIHPELKGKPIITGGERGIVASHPIEVRGKGRRGESTVREQTQLYGETRRKHLGLPLFQSEINGER